MLFIHAEGGNEVVIEYIKIKSEELLLSFQNYVSKTIVELSNLGNFW